MAFTQIDDYSVFYPSQTLQPRIELVNSEKVIGLLVFYLNGAALPPDAMGSGYPNLYYHLDDFEACASLLRNEETVWLLYEGSGPGFQNGLATAETVPGT